MKRSEYLSVLARSLKLFFSLDREYPVCLVLHGILRAAVPYVPIYFSARLVDALYEGESLRTVIWYVALTVGLVFLLSLVKSLVSARITMASQAICRSQDWLHSQKAMELSYESIEDRDVELLRDRVKMETQTGYDLASVEAWIREGSYYGAQILIACFLLMPFFFVPEIPLFMKLLFLAGVLLTVTCSVLTSNQSQKFQNHYYESVVNANVLFTKYAQYTGDYACGKDIRLYGMADGLSAFYTGLNQKWSGAYQTMLLKVGAVKLADTVMSHILKFGTYMLLIDAALQGNISVGAIAMYVSSMLLMLSAISVLVLYVKMVFHNHRFLQRFFSYFDLPNEMYQGSLTVEKRDDNEYFIEFRDVSFRYPHSDTYALRHVNLKFKIGEKLAVVGMNGSGKTTFIKLMCRLYDPTEGEILLNGVDIRKYDYDEYLSLFSIVFQDFRLFAFPLAQNVAASSTYDAKRVERCLIRAGFGERLAAMPDGTGTYLYKDFDKGGVEISGGEAQKIALARALYKDAPFMILDEPTSALDPVSEYEVYSKFNQIAGDKTAIYISHRLASCRFCDEIAVFDHGEIIQQGTHSQLLAQEDGKYYELWHAQAQYYVKTPQDTAADG